MRKFACAAALCLVAGTASASIVTVYDGVAAGKASFDATAAGAGATVSTDVWSSLGSGAEIDRGDYKIVRNDGHNISPLNYGTLSGKVISINPDGSGPGIGAFDSGITFIFDTAVNALGFELGDWGTCCHPSGLYMSFDDGAPINIFTAQISDNVNFPSQADPNWPVTEVFIAAFDDSGSFSKVSFWGDGFGEYLVAGGSVKYALLDAGTLPGVPLPAGGLLLASGLGLLALRRKRG